MEMAILLLLMIGGLVYLIATHKMQQKWSRIATFISLLILAAVTLIIFLAMILSSVLKVRRGDRFPSPCLLINFGHQIACCIRQRIFL